MKLVISDFDKVYKNFIHFLAIFTVTLGAHKTFSKTILFLLSIFFQIDSNIGGFYIQLQLKKL